MQPGGMKCGTIRETRILRHRRARPWRRLFTEADTEGPGVVLKFKRLSCPDQTRNGNTVCRKINRLTGQKLSFFQCVSVPPAIDRQDMRLRYGPVNTLDSTDLNTYDFHPFRACSG